MLNICRGTLVFGVRLRVDTGLEV